ncbi:MAG: hypothetical protein JSV80_07435 [Acidobacteriota bacterium]|nr:MAG: hypothetical protein JSV80_07435 [Acidobacteriota bacterium]
MKPLGIGLLKAVLLIGCVPLASAGEISLTASGYEGDYGTGVDAASRLMTLRYATGSRTRLRIDLPYLRFESSTTVTRTVFGATPTEGQKRKGEGPPNDAGDGTGPLAAATAEAATTELHTSDSWNTGMGDVRLALERAVAGGGVRLYRVDVGLEVKAPTADERDGLGTGEWDFRIGASAERRFWSWTGFGGLGWNRLGDPEGLELHDVLDGYAGIESRTLGDRFVVSGWLEAVDEVVSGTGSRTTIGIGFRTTGRVSWRATVLSGLSDAAPDLGLIAGLSFGVASVRAGDLRSQR